MALPKQSKVWILQNKPDAAVKFSEGHDATFALKIVEIPAEIPEDCLLVKTVLLSNDPTQRSWIQKGVDPKRLYVSPLQEGEIMRAWAVARVLKVGGSGGMYREGDLVATVSGWSEYAVVKKENSRVISLVPGAPPSTFLGVFGIAGLTAYWGLSDILKLQSGEKIIISGAAGAVGNVAVQLAKNVIGAKVIAIVGSTEGAEYIKGLGADTVLNYKSPTFQDELKRATPEYVETYFDNVGGDILGMVLQCLKRHGRVAACGAISGYNDPSKDIMPNYSEVIFSRLRVTGFVVLDYLHRPEGHEALVKAYKAGKLILAGGETIVEVTAFEEVPRVWHRLFEGQKQGKLITKLPE